MSNGAVKTSNGKNFMLVSQSESTFTSAILGNSVGGTIGNEYDFGIGTGTTTPTVSDTDNTTPITAWYGGGDYKPLSTSVVLDTGLHILERRGIVGFTEANGTSITEMITRTNSTVPVVTFHGVGTSVSKTANNQLILIKAEAIV